MRIPFLFLAVLVIIGSSAFYSHAQETVIKGNSMEMINRGAQVVFEGNVTLDRGEDHLKADRMETTQKKDKVEATGQVELTRKVNPQTTLRAFGNKGFYNSQTGDGYLLGKKNAEKSRAIYTEVVSSTVTRKMDILADRFDFSQKSSTAIARGNVYGWSKDPITNDIFEFWSDEATFIDSEKKIVLSGATRPRVHQKGIRDERFVEGDEIVMFVELKRFFSKGQAKAVFFETPQND